ncbi:MAG: DUF3137 domain-containing protein [Pseudomonadota bacterium]
MGDYSFDERHDHERGFSKVYDEKIAPYFRVMEGKRQEAVRENKKWVLIVFSITLMITALTSFFISPWLGLFPFVFVGAATIFVFSMRGGHLKQEMNSHIRPILCDFLGGMRIHDKPALEAFSMAALRDLNVLPGADRSNLGPVISGRWREVSYLLVKAHLEEEYRDSDNDTRRRTVFRGIVLSIECPTEMPEVVFLADYGETVNKLFAWAARQKRPDQKLSFPDPEFEKVFEVYTDDLDRAQKLLDPSFGQKLLEFSKDYQGGKHHVSAAFKARRFYMALDLTHDFMNFDVINRPLSEANDKIHAALADLMIPRRIIDTLLS